MNDEATTKRCTQCDTDKPLTEFHKSSAHQGGRMAECKPCMSSRMRAYYLKNRDRILARTSAWAKTERGRELRNAASRRSSARRRAKRRAEGGDA